MRRCFALVALALAVGTGPVLAQGPTTAETARAADPYDVPPHIGYLLQADALAGPEADPSGFLLRNARLRFAGSASGAARYFVQAELARTPAVLDARIALRLAGPVDVIAGLYKTPFSRELLTFRGALPTAERSRGVRALAPARQVGASLRAGGALGGADVRAEAGLFNGNGGRSVSNDGDGMLGVARAEARVPVGDAVLRFGASAAHGEDDAAPLRGIDAAFEGTRTVLGADLDLTTPRVYVLAEALAARLDGPDGRRQPWGAAVTASVEALPHARIVGRVDLFDDDPLNAALDAPPVRMTTGIDVEPQPHVRLVADYDFPTTDLADGDFRLRLQLALR